WQTTAVPEICCVNENQISPLDFSMIEATCPCGSAKVTSSRLFQCASPASVPIHKLPSRDPKSLQILDCGSSRPARGIHLASFTPSNRRSSFCVPIQMYPSAVCVIAWGAPLKYPSCVRQVVWAYWVIFLSGSVANALIGKGTSSPNASVRAAFVEMEFVSTN